MELQVGVTRGQAEGEQKHDLQKQREKFVSSDRNMNVLISVQNG